MNTLTHEEISQHARQLWLDRGSPEGCDSEIWLEAEQQLIAAATAAAVSAVENQAAHVAADHEAETVAIQKQEARAPQVPHHTGPKGKPATTGKPLWNKPHSS